MDKIVLKHCPEEFSVNENISLLYGEEGIYSYYLLAKKGYSTFDAVRIVAEYFGLPGKEICYAGLKDEDGVTQQTISVVQNLDENLLEVFNRQYAGATSVLKLLRIGSGSAPLKIGGLNGNSFLITVRNVDQFIGNAFPTGSQTILYLNYFGEQRFGLPGQPKLTHLIGEALILGEFDRALELVQQSGSGESINAGLFKKNSREFFKSLDSRLLMFYTSAYSSYQWNQSLRKQLQDLDVNTEAISSEEETIPFLYAASQKHIIRMMLNTEQENYTLYSVNPDLSFSTSYSKRPPVLQTTVRVFDVEDDDIFPERKKLKLSFSLLKGSYATTMIRQFFEMQKVALTKPFESNRDGNN